MMDASRLRAQRSSVKSASSSENVSSSYAGYDSNEGDNIKVYVRIRPPLKQIHNDNVDNSLCLEVSSPSSLIIATKPEPKQFSYDHVAGMDTTQEEVFATVGKGIIEAFANGFNGTIFAYGQTGSGKTFTMLGPADDSDNFSHELRGVIPRGFEYLFSLINRQQEKAGDRVEFLARCSFLEIYNEQVYDLLDPSSAGLHLRENIKKGVFVDGLAERDITTAKDAYNVLQSGWLNRRVASTSMNRESSRSHAVFTVTLESKKRTGGMNNIKISKLHLVDLAGSERQKDTHTQDLRLKEAGSINKSLSALGNVIMSLVDIAHGKTRHVHYRDSKLTFILRDSLGGNAKTYIIANVHPSSRCFGETLSTLNFARRAKMIKNKAVINEDVTGNVPELQAEIKKLKELLSQARAGNFVETNKSVDPTQSSKPVKSPTSGKITGNEEEWKIMMLNAISERDQSEKEKSALQEKVIRLEEICSKKDKFLQSTRMILKFRTSHITKLERQLKKTKDGESTEEDSKDKEIKLLREEIKLLQTSIDHHPEVKRFAMENMELRAEIKRLKTLDPSNGDFTKTMAEKHRYTLQLERQLKELMSTQSDDLEKSLSSSQQSLEASNAEIEKIKIELAQVQAKLDTSQNELKQTRQNLQQSSEELITLRENYRKKELELQSDLAAVRKSNNELERALETFQLKTAVERSAMNSLHIQTIKTLSSPMRLGSARSTPQKANQQNSSKFSTPLKKLNEINKAKLNGSLEHNHIEKQNGDIEQKHKTTKTGKDEAEEKYVNDPNRFIEDEPPPKFLERKDSLNDMSDDEDDVNPFDWSSYNTTRDDEVLFIEALQGELKQLQDLYSQSIQTLYDEQKKRIPLTEMIAKLEHKTKELEKVREIRPMLKDIDCDSGTANQKVDFFKPFGNTFVEGYLVYRKSLLSTERNQWNEKENDLTKQLTTLRDKYKETQGDATILKSEVDDLRILLSSADKQLDTLQREKREEMIETGRKYAALETKYVKLEIDFFNLQSENDATAESNNNLQADFEQCKEELEFARHKNSELEEIINIERKKLKEKDEELENAMERLSFELDNKIKLTQEDKEQELMHSMETINELREEIMQLTKQISEQKTTIERLTSDFEKSRSEIAVQKWMNLTDKEAINNFMKKVETLNSIIGEKDILVSSLQSELEDLKEQYQTLQNSYNEKKQKIHKLNEALKLESGKLAKEKIDREKEVTNLQEEIQLSQDQCKELSLTLEETQSQLQILQVEILGTKTTLADKMNTISMLEEQLCNKSTEDHESSLVIVNHDEVGVTNEQFNALAKSWESTINEKEKEIEYLKNKYQEYQAIENTRDLLEDRIKNLELEIEDYQQQRNEWQQKEISLQKQMLEIENIKKECSSEVQQVRELMEKAVKEKLVVQQQLSALEMNMCNVQDDLEANIEELEKTKVLEEKYFEEKTNLQSKLEVAEEEKKRYQEQIDELVTDKKKMELEHAKLVGHQNHAQRIQHHMAIKKENQQLNEEIRRLRLQLAGIMTMR